METKNFKIRVVQSRRYGKGMNTKTMNYSEVTSKLTGKTINVWLPKLNQDTDSLLINNYKW